MTNQPVSLQDVTSDTLAREAAKIMMEKKALDIRLYEVKTYTQVTDYYLNVTGRSATHVAALADDLADLTKERGRAPLRVEGGRGRAWILVDFGDVIVNVFDRPSREFYHFDHLLPAEGEVDLAPEYAAVDALYQVHGEESTDL